MYSACTILELIVNTGSASKRLDDARIVPSAFKFVEAGSPFSDVLHYPGFSPTTS